MLVSGPTRQNLQRHLDGKEHLFVRLGSWHWGGFRAQLAEAMPSKGFETRH